MMIQLLSEILPHKPIPFDIHCPRPDADSILVDDTSALMPKPIFDKLTSYVPKKIEEGRVWKTYYKGEWYLCFWTDEKFNAKTGITCIQTNVRKILFLR